MPRPTETQRRRVLTSAGIGLVCGLVLAVFVPWQLAVLGGWDVAAVIVCLRVWTRVGRFTPHPVRSLVINAILVGVAFGIVKAHESERVLDFMLTVTSVFTVVLSWTVVHTVFMLRYAHEYYTPPVGGIDFKSGDYEPDYRDFAYLAFTVGMTYQVSDTELNRREIRHTLLQHALLSYLFGSLIIGASVNFVVSLAN